MSNYTIKVQGGVFRVAPTAEVGGSYGFSFKTDAPSIFAGYTHQSGDQIRVTEGGVVFTATIAEFNTWGSMNFSDHAITGGNGTDVVPTATSTIEVLRGGTAILSGDYQDSVWMQGGSSGSYPEPPLSIGQIFIPQAGDTFDLTAQYNGSGTFNGTVVSWADPDPYGPYQPGDLVCTGTGAIVPDANGGNPSFSYPVDIKRGGVTVWTVQSDFVHWSHDYSTNPIGDAGGTAAPPPPNTGNSTMSNKLFTTLLGTYSSGQRMPEKIDVAGGDSVTLGPVTIDSSSITAAMFTGEISSLNNHTTDALQEAALNPQNLYFTEARARGSLVSPELVQASGNSMGSFSYDPLAGKFTLEQASDEWLRGRISVAQPAGDLTLSNNASDLAFLTYNAATGEIVFASADAGDVKGLLSAPGDDGLDYADGEFSLAQDIRTSASPTFAGMTVNGDLQVTGQKIIANVQTVEVLDNIIHLNKGEADPEVAGVRIESTEPMDKAILWVKTAGKFELREMPEDDTADSPLGDLLPIEALHFYGPLTGDVTGTVSDISNHDTDALTEGSTNLYFTEARVHAAVSAQKGVVESAPGVFEADIDASSQLAIQKDSGLKINFSVDDLESEPHHGALSYADNKLTFTPVKVSDIRGEVSLSVDQAGVNFGTAVYNQATGEIVITPAKQAQVRGAISHEVSAAQNGGDLSYDPVSGKITFKPADAAWVKAQLSASGDSLAYNSTTGAFSLALNATDSHLQLPTTLTEAQRNDELVARLEEIDGQFELKALKIGDIKGAMSVGPNVDLDFDPNEPNRQPLAKLAYDAASGESTFESMDVADVHEMFTVAPVSGDPAADAAAELVYGQDGEIKLKTMSKQDIRNLFSAGGQSPDGKNSLSYDDLTGAFTLDSLDAGEVQGYISHELTTQLAAPASNADLVAKVEYDAATGKIKSEAISMGQLRGMIAVSESESSPLMSLSYNAATGVLSFDPMTKAEMWAEFSADVDADSADQQFGDIDIVDGVIELVRVKGSEIKSVFQSGSNAIEYIENADGAKAGIKLVLDQTSSILSQSTAAGLRVDLSAANAAQPRVDNTTPLASLSEDDGTIELKSMSEGDVKAMLSADGKAARYDEQAGVISVAISGGILSQDAVGGLTAEIVKEEDSDALGLSNDATLRNAQRVAELTITDEKVRIDAMDIADIRGAFSRKAGSNDALTYDPATGEFNLADGLEFNVITADAFCDSGMQGPATSSVAEFALVNYKGEPALATVDAWDCAGSAHAGPIAVGDELRGKIEMMANGSVHRIACDGSIAEGDWVYLSASAAGKVTATRPDADGYAVVLVGRAKAADDNGSVIVMISHQHQYNC